MKKTRRLVCTIFLAVVFLLQPIHVFGEVITTLSGKSYDAGVIKPKPDGLILFLKSGKKVKVDFSDLSDETRKSFKYDQKKAEGYCKDCGKQTLTHGGRKPFH